MEYINCTRKERRKAMIIRQVNTGANGRKSRYFIENEGGGTVAYFDSLREAAEVYRYLNGCVMLEDDYISALTAMREFDERKGKNEAD